MVEILCKLSRARTKQTSRGGVNQPSSSGTTATDTPATASMSMGTTTRDHGSTVSEAVVYEQGLNKAAKDTKLLIKNSDGTQDINTTLIYSMFEVMMTCGHEVDNANPEIVIQIAIQNYKATHQV